jgi:2-polyprenyl-3-methyl-5-hydroxy-6-metoxy-1,4-benzoquinol methylase
MHHKTAGYYDNVNTALLDAIPPDAGLVVEIGCARGGLGAAHKARHPGCRVYGVEPHGPSAAIAAERLDMVLCGTVEAVDLAFLAGQVDCLVYGDVLEHLVDPWSVLAAHRALLAPGGRVVASIPNVQHWSLLRHLLSGGWTYHDHGLLDDTHLRFFTFASALEMFERAGLRVERTIGLMTSPEAAAAFVAALEPGLLTLGIDPRRLEQTASPLQYLVFAVCR